ncbi:MAG: twin-arginine translocation signal domain-containing protein [Bacteroidales bacterium]
MKQYLINRRNFLKKSTVAAAVLTAFTKFGHSVFAQGSGGVSIIVDPADNIAGSVPPQWALTQLREALEGQGMTVKTFSGISQAPVNDIVLVASSGSASLTSQIGANVPNTPEAITLMTGSLAGRPVVLVSGSDARGMVYAILELTDRVLYHDTIGLAFTIPAPIIEQTLTQTRTVNKPFVSEVEDKPHFYDKEYWDEYLTMVATERFNRFAWSSGQAYNFKVGQGFDLPDPYFSFVYPFFVSVQGVTVSDLSDAERQKNLDMLKYISDECARRGLDFQLGLWSHKYDYTGEKYNIQGLSGPNGGTTHAEYCRDALTAILEACPNITGLTFRVHGESGVDDSAFWSTVFKGATPIINSGRPLEIDMHGKRVKDEYLQAALDAKSNAVVTPKKVGEHSGLPYHHASIREYERRDGVHDPVTKLGGSDSRYGITNFMQEDRKYGVVHRMWPGTQRHLLWGDPVFAAGYGRAAYWCGSQGMEWYEPLCFHGRGPSGTTDERNCYTDSSLEPKGYDYHKFLYTYRIWGRHLYNPDTSPEAGRRLLSKNFGAAAPDIEEALANASRVLMLVTTNHGANGCFCAYWPEVYRNRDIVGNHDSSATSKANRETFDPQMWANIEEYTEALLSGKDGELHKYTPLEFADHLENYSNTALAKLADATSKATDIQDPEFRQYDIDIKIQAGLGLFFANKWRGGVLYYIYRKTNDSNAKTEGIKYYETALDFWKKYCVEVGNVYKFLDYGFMAGHWSGQVDGIQREINDFKNTNYNSVNNFTTHLGSAAAAIARVKAKQVRLAAGASHTQPSIFKKGSQLQLSINTDRLTVSAKLYYRHINQAEEWESVNMTKSGNQFTATIPGSYTDTVFPLQYYFGLNKGGNSGVIFPGFDQTLANQPYFHVRSVKA